MRFLVALALAGCSSAPEPFFTKPTPDAATVDAGEDSAPEAATAEAGAVDATPTPVDARPDAYDAAQCVDGDQMCAGKNRMVCVVGRWVDVAPCGDLQQCQCGGPEGQHSCACS